VIIDDRNQTAAKRGMIVHDEDSNGFRLGHVGEGEE
jgi:hypothetical protein